MVRQCGFPSMIERNQVAILNKVADLFTWRIYLFIRMNFSRHMETNVKFKFLFSMILIIVSTEFFISRRRLMSSIQQTKNPINLFSIQIFFLYYQWALFSYLSFRYEKDGQCVPCNLGLKAFRLKFELPLGYLYLILWKKWENKFADHPCCDTYFLKCIIHNLFMWVNKYPCFYFLYVYFDCLPIMCMSVCLCVDICTILFWSGILELQLHEVVSHLM